MAKSGHSHSQIWQPVQADASVSATIRLESSVRQRSGQTFTSYLNENERARPEDRSGRLAYHWVGRPMHVSFAGVIRERKVIFMIGATKSLAFAYRFTGEPGDHVARA